MKCLSSLVKVTQNIIWRGARSSGVERELASTVDQWVKRWRGHVVRMDEYRMAKWVVSAEPWWGESHTISFLLYMLLWVSPWQPPNCLMAVSSSASGAVQVAGSPMYGVITYSGGRTISYVANTNTLPDRT